MSVIDALKHEKENNKAFCCDDIAQIKSETCSISRRHIFKIKGSLFQHSVSMKSFYLDANLAKIFVSFGFELVSPTIKTNPDIRNHIGRMQTITGLYRYE